MNRGVRCGGFGSFGGGGGGVVVVVEGRVGRGGESGVGGGGGGRRRRRRRGWMGGIGAEDGWEWGSVWWEGGWGRRLNDEYECDEDEKKREKMMRAA